MMMKKMVRLQRILENSSYKEYYTANLRAEAERVFCHHDREHYAAVARVGYILWLRGEVHCPELEELGEDQAMEIIYTTAFLHDIGRFLEYADKTLDHAVESEKLSRPLLEEAGFSRGEQEVILKAIKNHRTKGTTGFDLLIYRADKESRLCSLCPALADCKKFKDKPAPPVTV